jgi:uncharacterized membrane protein
MFDFINVAFGWLMRQCYNLIETMGFGGYALALFLFALVCQIILFPFGIKQQKNSQKQARLRPRENVIRKKYNLWFFGLIMAIITTLSSCIIYFLRRPINNLKYSYFLRPFIYVIIVGIIYVAILIF